jgi:tetratricopeptide (TPR) repeat protein
MKNRHIIIATTMLISVCTFAQKEELKTLKKINEKSTPSAKDIAEYKQTLTATESLFNNLTEADKVNVGYFKAFVPVLEIKEASKTQENANDKVFVSKFFTVQNVSDLAKSMNAVIDFEKQSGKQVYTKKITEDVAFLKPKLVNYAVALADKSQYKESSSVLKSIYDIDKKDLEKLYYAANYAINAKDYDMALADYQELKSTNYTGEATLFLATNKATKTEESFNSIAERDLYIKAGTHEKPRTDKVPSKKPEIYRSIAVILVEQGKTEEAKAALKEARVANPDDASLILTEADIYYKANDLVTYKKLINEAIEKKPNDASLYYNLGVITSGTNQIEESEKYYKKAIELDPNYFDAYVNISELKLRKDEKLVKEMNKLTTSAKDAKLYTAIKSERETMFKSVIPYLEKAYELKPSNEDVSRLLLSVYGALDMTDKAKALKAKIKK